MTNYIYLFYLDLLVQKEHIHRSEGLRNKVNIIVSVRKTVCVMVPSVLWIRTMTCTLTTFDLDTLVTLQRKMTICGHSDRSERLKSQVKSEGKPTHAQSIFQLHYTSNIEFLNPIVKYPYSLQSCTLNVTLCSSGLKNYCTLCGFTGECNLDCHTCKTHARICSSQNYTQDAFSLLMTCTEVRLGLCNLRHSN